MRVRTEALALVNWKGVFYERYQLDRHVTALEGDNGAGKTTVMIAAYVVLLPDMTRLRFTNLGETGATGGDKGIWGRLGEPGRPSYAALDFRLPRAERVVAGVHLERKGEPTVEPTPFLVTDLAEDVQLQDILLLSRGELDLVPELGELRESVARAGGRLTVFSSARDYFAALFERGITPLRLGTDEERNKLNEMLKTSMTGGMSRGLLSELRSFLLKEDTGLASTIEVMRSNLEACRRTRSEVEGAQRTEREISAVYEAGEAMFAAAVHAAFLRAAELENKHQEADAKAREAAAGARAAEEDLDAVRGASFRAARRLTEAGYARDNADAYAKRAREALACRQEAERGAEALREAARAHDEAGERRARAEEALGLAQAAAGRARDDRDRVAEGLADLQKGLEELHRRAGAYSRVTRALRDAERLLEISALDPEKASPVREAAARRLAATDAERRELARRVDDASTHREEHARALAALAAVRAADPEAAGAAEAAPEGAPTMHRHALVALERARGWRERAARKGSLRDELRRVEAEAERAARVEERARAAGLTWSRGRGRAAVTEALSDVEERLTARDAQAYAADLAGAEARRAAVASKLEASALQARAAAYRELTARAGRLGEAVGGPVTNRAELDGARAALAERRYGARARAEALTARRDRLRAEARALRQLGGQFSSDLLRLRDDLDARLLAVRFDDLPVDEAAHVEARLGPLAQALVVEDLERATEVLHARPASLATVWLVDEQSAPSFERDVGDARDAAVAASDGGRGDARDVVVDERDGRRVTRVPDRPTLGRVARERRAAEFTREADALASGIEAARAEDRAAEAALAEAAALGEGLAVWLEGDPAPALAACAKRLHEAEAAARAAQLASDEARAEARALRPRCQDLRELLPDAALLDAPDFAARLAEARAALAAAEAVAAAVARAADAPKALEALVESLRHEPLSEAAIEEALARARLLAALRDALVDGIEALDYVVEHRAARAWHDAADELAKQKGLVPALHAALEAAKDALDRAQAEEAERRVALDAATRAFHETHAKLMSARERLADAERRFADADIDDPTEGLVEDALREAERAREALAALQAEVAELQCEEGRRQEALKHASAKAAERRADEEEARRKARPAIDSWTKLRAQVEAAGLFGVALADRHDARFEGLGSPAVWQRADKERTRLVERLRGAEGGRALLADVEPSRGLSETASAEGTSGEEYLRVWRRVRDWLRSRLPAQIADVDDPLVALGRFRDHLVGLRERLEQNERDLRGASEDVARGIDVQIRGAQGRVRRLTENLRGVRFGSVDGIRVRLQRVERMEQVLRALRSGEAQGLLFQADLPIEEALAELSRRYGGGRTVGQKLLDYREYIALQVEVRRQDRGEWEHANPTRLSTGEAIGVGAALMMVVLTEWERDANLLRGKRAFGSARFLFLDEANRLDQANLATVFELCRHLDLQLLVAAPEVARAEGCTVFRLVRARTDDAREEVLVSGRRIVRAAAPARGMGVPDDGEG